MIRKYLMDTWAYLRNHDRIGNVGFDEWVNSLTIIELVEYIDAADAESV